MRFSSEEVELARELRSLGLPWTPGPGNYVWDEESLIDCPSPFHDRVYFILDLKHFLRRAKTMDALKEALIWLPTWHDARLILDTFGVSWQSVAERLEASNAIVTGCELATLYRMIRDQLIRERDQAADKPSTAQSGRLTRRTVPAGLSKVEG